MKKKSTILGTALTVGVLFTMMTVNVFAEYITGEKAKTIALDNVGIQATEVPFVEIEADYDNGRLVYEVEFWTKDNKKYEYDINAADGVILTIECKTNTVLGWNTQNQTNITLEQAKAAAVAHTGQKAEDVTYVTEKSEYDDGRLVYEMEFYTTDSKWYEYEIDGLTGIITEWKYDTEKCAAWKAMNQAQESIKEAVLKMAGLTANDSVVWGKIKQDYEDGKLVYEGKFYYNMMKYEFEIDAATGIVIDWEVESIYD